MHLDFSPVTQFCGASGVRQFLIVRRRRFACRNRRLAAAFRRWSRVSVILYSTARASYRRSRCTGKSCCLMRAVFRNSILRLSSQLREADDAQNGEVAFGCGPAPGARLIPAAIGEFHRLCRRRGCVFTLITGLLCIRRLPPSTILLWSPIAGRAELDPQLRVQPLSPQRCFFVCHAEHPLAKQGTISIQEMLRYPLPPPICRRGTQGTATLSQQQDFTPAIQCDHIYALLSTLAQTHAISFASRTASRCASTAIGW